MSKKVAVKVKGELGVERQEPLLAQQAGQSLMKPVGIADRRPRNEPLPQQKGCALPEQEQNYEQ